MNPGPPDTQVEDQVSRDVLIAAYTVVGARRTSLDTMMWQVPALATAAQAFLLTIALQTDGSRAAQAIAAALGAVLAVLSAQLMAKHRHLEMSDSRLTERIERQLGLERRLGVAPTPPAGSASANASRGGSGCRRTDSGWSVWPRSASRTWSWPSTRWRTWVSSVEPGRAAGQAIAAFTTSMIFCSTSGLHFWMAYDTGQMSPSSSVAASWNSSVE